MPIMDGYQATREIRAAGYDDLIICGLSANAMAQDLSLAKEESLEFMISNTTEAGIAYVASDTLEMQPPSSFPAKLTVLLYERFKHFKGDTSKGLTIIPTLLFTSDSGYAKLEIAIAKGKKLFDKRDDMKAKDIDRDLKRKFNN